MKPVSRSIFVALIALCWSGLAVANPEDSSPSVDTSDLRAVTNVRLDLAFESFVSEDGADALTGLAGPTTMECSGTAMRGEIETCLVTTDRLASTSPASLAQH
jgi:hypothetical protein